jgi:hypothetical protein
MVDEEVETRGRSRSNSQTHLQTSQQELGKGRPGLPEQEKGGQGLVSMLFSSSRHWYRGWLYVCLWLGNGPTDTNARQLKRQSVKAFPL